MLNSKALKSCAKRYPMWAGIGAALFGQLIIVSWFAHWRFFLQMVPNTAPMAYNTALCLDASGIGLLLLTTRRAYARVAGIAVFLVGAVTSLEYLGGGDYGIDQLFFHPYFNAFSTFPGRMAPLAAACFVLLGAAITQLGSSPHRHRFSCSGIVACVVAVIAVVAIIGYVFSIDAAYGWGSYSRMAINTAVVFFVLGTGILVFAADQAPRREGTFIRWLPVTASITLMLMIGFVSAMNRADLQNSTFWRRHTFQVILQAQSFEETIVDTQRGLHSYIGLGDPSSLAALNAAIAREPRLLGSLISLTSDNPLQQARLRQLGSAIKELINHDLMALSAFKSGGTAAFTAMDSHGENRALVGRVRTELKAFSVEEQRLLDLRDSNEQRDSGNAGRLLVFGSVMAAFLLVVAYCAIGLEMKHRHRAEIDREVLIGELQHALAEVKSLTGMIPICGWCKSIRTDDGYWQSVEQYVCTHTEATFTHGVCPDCSVKLEADLDTPPPKPVARSVVRQTVQSRGA